MAKRYKSVLDLVEDINDDKEFHSQLKEEIENKSLAKTLFAMRCSKGITQQEMANRLDCTQGKISKLENSTIDTIKVSDLVGYSKALKLQMSICFHDRLTATDRIKLHIFGIKRNLDRLAKFAHRDKAIDESVRKFIGDTLFNFFKTVKESVDLLPKQIKPKTSKVLEICPPQDFDKVEIGEQECIHS